MGRKLGSKNKPKEVKEVKIEEVKTEPVEVKPEVSVSQ